jgi:hypothetical protein
VVLDLLPAILHTAQPFAVVHHFFFLLYQSYLIVACGLVNGFTVLALSVAEARHSPNARRFWLPLVLSGVLVGHLVLAHREVYGMAHSCLQPLIICALIYLAIRLPSAPRWLRTLTLVGVVADSILGIWVHILAQDVGEISERGAPFDNFLAKGRLQLAFFGDRLEPWSIIVYGLSFLGYAFWLMKLVSELHPKQRALS